MITSRRFYNAPYHTKLAKKMMSGTAVRLLLGAAVGDALGVPFEFMSRGSFCCSDMEANAPWPPGTWSDDTALTLAEFAAMHPGQKLTADSVMENFVRWYESGEFSCTGSAFGIGRATQEAIRRFQRGVPPVKCGGIHFRDNGNGALMRLAPLCLLKEEYFAEPFEDFISMTHGHELNKICGLFYRVVLRKLLQGTSVTEAYALAYAMTVTPEAQQYLPNSKQFERLEERDITSGGFVADTLVASLWSVKKTTNFRDCVLTAVNLGDDTDTTATVAGAAAGLIYGIGGEKGIPEEWIERTACKNVLLTTAQRVEPMMLQAGDVS